MGKLNLKYGLVTLGLVATATAATMPGCSAEGVTGGDEDSGSAFDATTIFDVGAPDTSTPDAAKDSGTDAKKDTGTDAAKDAKDSSTVDSGLVGPAPGSACPTPGVIFKQTCGFCGQQEAVCEQNNTVSQYGPCSGEVANGCTPGSSRQTTCGLCGTKNEICQNNCQWASGQCGGEPANACTPGAIKYTTAGCSLPNTFRKQVCENTCQYGLPAPLPCIPKDNDLTIASAVGSQVSNEFDFSPLNDQLPRLNSITTCPSTTSASNTSYKYVEVKNPTAQTAKVEIWFDNAVGGVDIDTIVTYYPGNVIPTGAARLACSGTVNDFCSTAPCTSSWSGLVGNNAATIPPNSSIMLYHAVYSTTITGSFTMFAKTISLQ
ncbi:MAG: hypothetical protein U0174_16235 [Polyangiaceae bacterium]